VCARTHEHRAGSLCTKRSNNNNRGFSGFLKMGGGSIFLKFSTWEGPISSARSTRGAALPFDFIQPVRLAVLLPCLSSMISWRVTDGASLPAALVCRRID
jgi:hypothetical protein